MHFISVNIGHIPVGRASPPGAGGRRRSYKLVPPTPQLFLCGGILPWEILPAPPPPEMGWRTRPQEAPFPALLPGTSPLLSEGLFCRHHLCAGSEQQSKTGPAPTERVAGAGTLDTGLLRWAGKGLTSGSVTSGEGMPPSMKAAMGTGLLCMRDRGW